MAYSKNNKNFGTGLDYLTPPPSPYIPWPWSNNFHFFRSLRNTLRRKISLMKTRFKRWSKPFFTAKPAEFYSKVIEKLYLISDNRSLYLKLIKKSRNYLWHKLIAVVVVMIMKRTIDEENNCFYCFTGFRIESLSSSFYDQSVVSVASSTFFSWNPLYLRIENLYHYSIYLNAQMLRFSI